MLPFGHEFVARPADCHDVRRPLVALVGVGEVVDLEPSLFLASPALEPLTDNRFAPAVVSPLRSLEVDLMRVLALLLGRTEVASSIAVKGGIGPQWHLRCTCALFWKAGVTHSLAMGTQATSALRVSTDAVSTYDDTLRRRCFT